MGIHRFLRETGEKPEVEEHSERRNRMNFINFVAWLTAGAVIGWFASRMVDVEKRRVLKLVPVEKQSAKN